MNYYFIFRNNKQLINKRWLLHFLSRLSSFIFTINIFHVQTCTHTHTLSYNCIFIRSQASRLSIILLCTNTISKHTYHIQCNTKLLKALYFSPICVPNLLPSNIYTSSCLSIENSPKYLAFQKIKKYLHSQQHNQGTYIHTSTTTIYTRIQWTNNFTVGWIRKHPRELLFC